MSLFDPNNYYLAKVFFHHVLGEPVVWFVQPSGTRLVGGLRFVAAVEGTVYCQPITP